MGPKNKYLQWLLTYKNDLESKYYSHWEVSAPTEMLVLSFRSNNQNNINKLM